MTQNQMSFIVNEQLENKSWEPVECLGMTFESDEKRREYFLETWKGFEKSSKTRNFARR